MISESAHRPRPRSPFPRHARRSSRVSDANAVGVADRSRLVELAVRVALELGELVRQRAVERDLEHVQSDDARSALGREPAGEVHRRVGRLPGR